jgi:hypothetical protein
VPLGALIPAAEQDDQQTPTADEMYPVPRAVIDPKLRHTFTDRFHITHQSRLQPDDPLDNAFSGTIIVQALKPFLEDRCLAHLDHL